MKKMTRLELDTRIAKLSRWNWIVLLLAVLIGGMLATLSVARYRGYNVSMLDIGNMFPGHLERDARSLVEIHPRSRY